MISWRRLRRSNDVFPAFMTRALELVHARDELLRGRDRGLGMLGLGHGVDGGAVVVRALAAE
jgi:hypothetical protein